MNMRLSDIRTRFLLLDTQNPIFKKFYTGGLTENEVFDLISVFKPNRDFKRYQVYKEFIEYAKYKSYCYLELQDLAGILKNNVALEQQPVREWIFKNRSIYGEVFGLQFRGDNEKTTDIYFYLPGPDEFLEKVEFLPVIAFCEIIGILDFGQYHMPASEREIPDPKNYYYVPSTPEAHDLITIQTILNTF